MVTGVACRGYYPSVTGRNRWGTPVNWAWSAVIANWGSSDTVLFSHVYDISPQNRDALKTALDINYHRWDGADTTWMYFEVHQRGRLLIVSKNSDAPVLVYFGGGMSLTSVEFELPQSSLLVLCTSWPSALSSATREYSWRTSTCSIQNIHMGEGLAAGSTIFPIWELGGLWALRCSDNPTSLSFGMPGSASGA